MTRISFLNGKFLPHDECFIHIEDRGFQFSDGIYEVVLLKNKNLIDIDWHLDRLFYSLDQFDIKIDKNKEEIKKIILELFAKNDLNDGSVYLQITRGKAPRGQGLPKECPPTIVATVLPLKNVDSLSGLKVMTHEDIRWQRCDIKSTGLIATSMIRQKAFDKNLDDAILIRDGFITEATFANVFIVDDQENLITRKLDNFVLGGIVRKRIVQIAKENGIKVLEKNFTAEELLNAKEVFLTSTTLFIRFVVQIDEKLIGDGKIGKISSELSSFYQKFMTN